MYIFCFFTIWNLKSAITYNCGQVVLSRTSVYIAISKLILLFVYSFHHTFCHYTFQCLFLINFLLIDHNRKQVLLIKWVILFLNLKNSFFALFKFFKIVIFRNAVYRRWSALWNSTLKLTILFRRCLTLFISMLK